MIGQLSGNKQKRFMQACKISGERIWLLALILLVVTAPSHAAIKPGGALHFAVSNLSGSEAKHLIDEADEIIESRHPSASLAATRKEGFRVIGSTWKKPEIIRAFSRYATQHGDDGMMATTWFPVQSKQWDVIEEIIRESGEAFSKDFPDDAQ